MGSPSRRRAWPRLGPTRGKLPRHQSPPAHRRDRSDKEVDQAAGRLPHVERREAEAEGAPGFESEREWFLQLLHRETETGQRRESARELHEGKQTEGARKEGREEERCAHQSIHGEKDELDVRVNRTDSSS